MEELVRDYKAHVQDEERFERLVSNYLLGEIEAAIDYVVDAIQTDLDINLQDQELRAHYDIRDYLKSYLRYRAHNSEEEEPWFNQGV